VAVAVDVAEYRRRMNLFRKGKPFSPLSSYTWSTLVCMTLVASLYDRRAISQGILYMMDCGAGDFRQTSAAVTDMYMRNREERPYSLWESGLLPGNIRDFPQIQAADVIAYCVRELVSGAPDPRVVPYLDLLIEKKVQIQYHYAHEPKVFDRLESKLSIGVEWIKKVKLRKTRERKLGKSASSGDGA
jgi:hypothetical protein